MIERLTPQTLHLCLEGGRLFFEEARHPGGFVPDVFLKTFGGMLDSGQGIVLASFDTQGDKKTITGALGGVLAPNPFNGWLMAIEMFWFMLPAYRGRSDALRLFSAFEDWAAEVNAKMISMIHLTQLQPKKLGALYERWGYSPIEVNYLKTL